MSSSGRPEIAHRELELAASATLAAGTLLAPGPERRAAFDARTAASTISGRSPTA